MAEAPFEDVQARFAEYARTRDPEAMAAVFDATAPRLLLLAMHLTRDAAAAEDLLQTTFLQAIRDVEDFDARQPVLPWLTKILVHRARDARRRNAVRRHRPLEAAAEPPSRERDPAAAAIDAELALASRALQALEEPYRSVLVLRLVHGLRAIDIAHALGRSPGAVRMQLKRGLERLRRWLPKGLGVPAALVLGNARGLAAVRAEVLAAAKSVPVATGAVAIGLAAGGVLLMKKSLVVVGALAIAGAVLLLARPSSPDGVPFARVPAAGAPGELRDANEDAGRVVQAAPAAARELLADDGEGDGDDEPVTIAGRCVADENGAPLAGCEVAVEVFPRTSVVPWQLGECEGPPPQRTGPDGRFAFRFPLPRDGAVDVAVSSPERVAMAAHWESLQPGVVLDVGDVRLARGVLLRIVAADADGTPLAGRGVQLDAHEPSVPAPWFRALRVGMRQTDAEGRWPEIVVRPGRYLVRVHDHPYRFRGPHELEVPAGIRQLDVTLVFERGSPQEVLQGRVVDERGAPVTGLELAVQGKDDVGYRPTTTGADGTFFSSPLPQDGGPFAIGLVPGEECFELLGERRTWAPGTSGIELRVRRVPPMPFVVQVVDERSGLPVERFAWSVVGGRDFMVSTVAVRAHERPPAQQHPGGEVRIADRRPGPHWLSVWPEDRALAPRTYQPFQLGDGSHRVRVGLRPVHQVDVRVVDEAGAPVPGVQVELARYVSGRARDADTTRVRPIGEDSRGSYALVALSAGTTDEAGAVRLTAAVFPEQDLLLHATAATIVPLLADDVEASVLAGACTLVVRAAARVSGTVAPPELLAMAIAAAAPDERQQREHARRASLAVAGALSPPWRWRPQVHLCREPEPGSRLRPVHSCAVGEDGTFAIDAIEPGSYVVAVELFRQDAPTPVGGALHLAPGEHVRVRLDASQLWPGAVRGVAVLPPGVRGEWIELAGADARRRAPLQEDGSFEFARVPAGEYLALVRGDEAGRLPWFAERPVRVVRGERTEAVLQFVHRTATLRIVGADGVTPVAKRRLRLRWLDHPHTDSWAWFEVLRTTDAHGVLQLDPAPPGTLRVIAVTGGDEPREVVLGTVTVAAPSVARTLRLPGDG